MIRGPSLPATLSLRVGEEATTPDREAPARPGSHCAARVHWRPARCKPPSALESSRRLCAATRFASMAQPNPKNRTRRTSTLPLV